MKIPIEVDAVEVRERTTDGRGRLSLGADLADKTVTFALIDVEDEDDQDEPDDVDPDDVHVQAYSCDRCQKYILVESEPDKCPSCRAERTELYKNPNGVVVGDHDLS